MGKNETGNGQTPTPAILRVGRNDAGYPQQLLAALGSQAPEQLYLQGNAELHYCPNVFSSKSGCFQGFGRSGRDRQFSSS